MNVHNPLAWGIKAGFGYITGGLTGFDGSAAAAATVSNECALITFSADWFLSEIVGQAAELAVSIPVDSIPIMQDVAEDRYTDVETG